LNKFNFLEDVIQSESDSEDIQLKPEKMGRPALKIQKLVDSDEEEI
jgi:hypothetical protein